MDEIMKLAGQNPGLSVYMEENGNVGLMTRWSYHADGTARRDRIVLDGTGFDLWVDVKDSSTGLPYASLVRSGETLTNEELIPFTEGA